MGGDVNESVRKHPLAECERCPLADVGRFVPSVGPKHATLAFVGEAPGLQEARSGIPFSGPSGKLLDTINRHHGIRREDVFLTNACLCRPPDNATPAKTAIEACRGRLDAELTEHGVETVVALGNTAAQSILGQSGITKLRVGPGRGSPRLPGVRVIPTLHPAAALRQADIFPSIVTDIGKVVAPHVVWTEPEYEVADTEVDAIRCLRAIENATYSIDGAELHPGSKIGTDVLVIDIEVDVEKDIAFDHPNQYGMLCVGIGYAPSKVLVLGEGAMGSESVRAYLGQLLLHRRLGGQNLKFDLAGLWPILKLPLEGYYDTMLASYTFDERPGVHGLKYMAVENLGAPQYDAEIQKYVGPGIGYGAIPRDKLYKYNATDIACTWHIMDQQLGHYEALGEEGRERRRVHDFLVAASNQLMYVELNGIAIDKPYLDTLHAEFVESLERLEKEIDRILGKDYDKYGGINPRSWMQVKAALADMGVKVDSTNEDTINLVIEQTEKRNMDDKEKILDFCRTLLRHRKEAKLHGTYVKGIAKRLYRGRVHSTYLLHGTTTGRLSSRNPNLQNIPRDSKIKRMFVPAVDGNVFVQTDYSQAELRMLCYMANDTYFRDIFNGGERDIFEELTPILYPNADRSRMDAAAWKELRIRVKAYVYGLAYGRTEFSIATEYGIPIGEAKRGMSGFFDVIPEIVRFRERTRRRVLDGEDLVTPWGRHRSFGLITAQNIKDVMNEALAFMPQSTASDCTLFALTNLRKELAHGYHAFIRNIVHDSLLVECLEDDAEDVRDLVERRMVEAGQHIVGDYVKIAVESKIGKDWGSV